jgi:MFS family permease
MECVSRPLPSASPVADEGEHLDPRRWLVLSVCVTALFMTLLDATIINVALPSIGSTLHANAAQQQWVVSGYALAFGMVPIIAGRLGDDRGRRRMLLVGIAGFVVTSLLAGIAPNPAVLLGARLLQGLSGGLINPQVSGLVQQLFPLRERGKAFGLIGLNVGLAQALGPVLGGVIIAIGGTALGWRLTFLINVPVGTLAFALAWRLLPRDPARSGLRRLDLPGAALLAAGLAGVLFPVVEYDADRKASRLLLIAPAVLVIVVFGWWERGPGRRRGYPLIDINLFRIRSYSDGLGLALLYFAGFTGTALVLSLFLQNGLGFSALQAGLTASSFAAGLAIGAPGGRPLRQPPRPAGSGRGSGHIRRRHHRGGGIRAPDRWSCVEHRRGPLARAGAVLGRPRRRQRDHSEPGAFARRGRGIGGLDRRRHVADRAAGRRRHWCRGPERRVLRPTRRRRPALRTSAGGPLRPRLHRGAARDGGHGVGRAGSGHPRQPPRAPARRRPK